MNHCENTRTKDIATGMFIGAAALLFGEVIGRILSFVM